MGSQIQKVPEFDLIDHTPQLQDYKLKHSGPNYCVWQHCIENFSLIEFPANLPNQQSLKREIDTYLFRHRHPFLVSSLFFRKSQKVGKASVFYERVYTNLSRIKDIPFGDSLQFYYVGLKGFQLLYKRYGYFDVEESMFHITKNHKIKVWCQKDIQKILPNSPGLMGSEGDMVKSIVRIIEQNSDCLGRFPVGQAIYDASQTFDSAIQRFRSICKENFLQIPEKLTCLDIICEGQVGLLLDEYGQMNEDQNGFNNRQSYDYDSFYETPLSQGVPNSLFSNDTKLMYPAKQNNFNQGRKNSRKGRGGLKVSQSLDRKSGALIRNSNREMSPPNRANRIPGLPLSLESPIKVLTRQTFFQPQANIPSQIAPEPLPLHLIERNNHNQRFPSVPRLIPSHSQPLFVGVPRPVHFPLHPQSVNFSSAITRKNSVDNLNSSGDNFNQSSGYKVVINYASRPQSRPEVPQITNQSKQIYRNPPNNLLNVTPSSTFQNSVSIPPTPPRFFHQNNVKLESKLDHVYSNDIKPNPLTYKSPSDQLDNGEFSNFMAPLTFGSRTTNINKLTPNSQQPSQNWKVQANPLQDYTNFKSRFEEYKRNFDFGNKNDKQYNKTYESIKINDNKYQSQNKKAFFFGDLNVPDTISSFIDNDNYEPETKIKKSPSKKSVLSDYDFGNTPNETDNISNIYNKPKESPKNWRQESVVVKHDVNTSKIKFPESNKYCPQIDGDIWSDMMQMRKKKQFTGEN